MVYRVYTWVKWGRSKTHALAACELGAVYTWIKRGGSKTQNVASERFCFLYSIHLSQMR